MDERATGIIVRTRPLTETSLIIHWLTAESGRIATVAKGARRAGSPFSGKLDLFYEASFTFARSRRSELHSLREIAVLDMHSELRRNLGWVQQAAYAIKLIEQVTETEAPVAELFSLLREFVSHLPRQPPQPRSIYALELKLLRGQGLLPPLDATRLIPAAAELGE